jgi:hypothetical protein
MGGGKKVPSAQPPAPTAAMAQNVTAPQDTASEINKLASDAKKRGYWWTQVKNRDGDGNAFGTGL